MADKPKVVRLVNAKTGVLVETTDTIAANLSGFEPEKKSAKAAEKSS